MKAAVPLIAALAAGRASRFGGGKLDAPCAGKPVGCWCLDAVAAAGAPPGIIVTAARPPRFAEAAAGEGWRLAVNPRADEGLGTSIACAAAAAQESDASALILLLADMPLVDAAIVTALLTAEDGAATATAWPDGRAGVPARFPAAMFPSLKALAGDRGAGPLLRETPDIRLLRPPPAVLADVDSTDDLIRAERLLRAR